MKHFPIALFVFLSSFSQAIAVVLDLRNLPLGVSSYSLTVDDITINLGGAGGGGLLVSDTCCFGIDSAGTGDVPNLLDGGSGRAEVLGFVFDQDVFVDSILISFFGPNDSGSASIKGSSPAVSLQNGVNDLGGIIARRSSANFITWTGRNISDPDLGFSIDSITVRPIPELSCLLLTAVGTPLILRRRRASYTPRQKSPNEKQAEQDASGNRR
jgi:hypothetical protein